MIVLAFDTCLEACSAAVAGPDGRVFSRFEWMAQGHAERLVPMIGEVMAEAGLCFRDLDRIGVTTGPGSFTGTRISVAAARAFVLAHRVPLVGLSPLALMAGQAAQEGNGRPILIAVDVRRGEAYCQLFEPAGLIAIGAPQLLSVAEAAGLAVQHGAFVAGSAAAAVAEAAGSGANLAAGLPDLMPDARYAVILVQSAYETTHSVAPLYLRPPDAKPPAKSAVQLQPGRET